MQAKGYNAAMLQANKAAERRDFLLAAAFTILGGIIGIRVWPF